MMKKRLPYGQSSYNTLVNDNFIYVDKTEYIEKLEKLHDTFIFFLRPRRFGKSLFTSVLENYYDVNKENEFEKLFGNTYIGQNPTNEKNGYYILKFNFSKLNTDTTETLEESFLRAVNRSLNTFMREYNIELEFNNKGFAASVFDDFLGEVKYKIDKPIYVIIDEYDHFANELLSFKSDIFSEIISKTGFVRKWYETLKVGTETVVKRIFATGVSPITLDSLTSGFNIASDITRDPRFNEMMGFTEDEVRSLIVNTLHNRLEENELDSLVEELRKNYNGYLFSEKGKKRLFNSDMILYYLKSYEDFGSGPQELVDKNIASDYGKLSGMFDLKNKKANLKVLDKIICGEKLKATITSQFSMEKDFDEDYFKSLLFYLGMLTIDKEVLNRVILKVPNYAIEGLYFDFFMKKINESVDYELDIAEVKESIEDIALEGTNDALVSIVEKTLNKLSNRDYIKFDEKYIK
ncbi:MAG: AAA family ATPase, partial [Clostridium sp.]